MKSLLAAFALVFMLVSTPLQAAENEPYEFMTAVIDSLSMSANAVNRFKNTDRKNMLDIMKAYNTLNYEIGVAEGFIKPYTNSKNELISDPAVLLKFSYSMLIINFTKTLDLLETMLNEPEETSKQQGTFQRELSEISSTIDTTWRSIPQHVALSVFALVDEDRTDKDNKVRYLIITQKQRESLLKQLEDAFGPDVKKEPKGGSHALLVSAQLLWEFLNQPWIASDE